MTPESPPGRDPSAAARLLEAASEVDRRAERARRRVDELEQTLTELAAALAGHEAGTTATAVRRTVAQPPAVAPELRLRARAVADGARMLAIELAATGAPREAIRAQIQQRFGVTDPDEILDGVLVPEPPGSTAP
jgi:hypothetical protein